MRDHRQIDGLWRFSPDPSNDGEALGFWRHDHDMRLWREVMVPSCFEAGCPDIDHYEGVCWYRRAFRLPPTWIGRRVLLRFEAVSYRARVWLDGEWLGENRDGFLPFEFDIRERVRWDGENVLAVSVDNSHHAGDVPGMHVGWRGFGGILREVSVAATDLHSIDRFRIVAEPCAEGGRLECRLRVRNVRTEPADGTLEVSVYQGTCETALLTMGPCATSAAAGASADVALAGVLPGARSWSPSAPVLYRAVASLRDRGGTVDKTEVRFGFRRVEAVPGGLLLNGERIYLTGFNRHEDSPATAMATDLGTARRDLEQMKEAGCNFVRLCHYPHHPAELDLCDELGLLAFCEIPLYFWNDVEDGRRAQGERVQAAMRQLERMIGRDGNHPSVIFWSVSNETRDDEPAVAESNRALIRRARELDPTRLCVHVSNHWLSHPNFDEDDVVCLNHYPSLDWRKHGRRPGSDLSHAAAAWRTGLESIHRLYPSKPVLVTEFGYCSFAGTHGNAFGEDEHARVIEAEFAAMDEPFVCGATIWCWADHPWPARRFVGRLGVSPYGVVSRDRRKLEPFWTARRMFRSKHGLLTAPPSAGMGEHGIRMVRPHMNDIPAVPFPEGFGVRPMTVEDIGLWTDIERDAEPYLKIRDTTFMEEFGDDLQAIRWRCFIMTNPKGLGVGTISAWYDRDFHGEDYGRIHWLAVRPSFQEQGLGKCSLSYALEKMAQWHDRCYLQTSTQRVAAAALYLGFGFEPDLRPPNALAAWRELGTRLEHPVLDRVLGQKGSRG
jgi:beta-galactosidase/beta-glucuronidase/GNAT superfamily N-acetyltransferase